MNLTFGRIENDQINDYALVFFIFRSFVYMVINKMEPFFVRKVDLFAMSSRNISISVSFRLPRKILSLHLSFHFTFGFGIIFCREVFFIQRVLKLILWCFYSFFILHFCLIFILFSTLFHVLYST